MVSSAAANVELAQLGLSAFHLPSLDAATSRLHTLAANTMEIMLTRLKYTPLQFHFTPEAAIRVWTLANEAEREQLRAILLAKIARAKTLWPEEKMRLIERMLGLPEGASNGASSRN